MPMVAEPFSCLKFASSDRAAVRARSLMEDRVHVLAAAFSTPTMQANRKGYPKCPLILIFPSF
jgi:hypothetical protein